MNKATRKDIEKVLGKATESLGLLMLSNTPESHVVDYDQSLEEMIRAGNYDYLDPEINKENFPISGKGRVEYEDLLLMFERDMTLVETQKRIATWSTENPWEPAKIENLLAFGVRNPGMQLRTAIIGLGSIGIFEGKPFSPCLHNDQEGGTERDLCLQGISRYKALSVCLLVVRKKIYKVSAPASPDSFGKN